MAMLVTSRFVINDPVERTATLSTRFPVMIDTTARAIGLDLGHGYRAYVLGRGPILIETEPTTHA